MPDQTPGEQVHPLAALGIAAETLRLNEKVSRSYERITLTGPSALQRADSALRVADHHLSEYNAIPFNQEDPAMMAMEGVVKSLREAVGALTEHAQTEALHAQLARGIAEAERGETVDLDTFARHLEDEDGDDDE